MAGTTIDGLNAVTSLTAQDEVPVWDKEASGEPTKKITAQNMASSVKTLGSLVNTGEMNTALAGKQNTLTFDTTPTTGSTNPVTSGGIADAITQSTASTKSGIVTMATGTSQIFVRQYGNVVCIGGWVSNATLTANTRTKIADITGISYPPDVVRAFCNVGANAYSVGTLSYISLSTSGELTVTSSNGGTGKAIYFDICYVANN